MIERAWEVNGVFDLMKALLETLISTSKLLR
jgi:hypothetical protein